MAIRNTQLGGTDWVATDIAKAEDLNDTFDAAYNKIQTLSVFWLNTELYSVFDDFESYSTGAFTTTAKWEVTLTGAAASCDVIVATINATGQELRLNMYLNGAAGGTTQVSSITLAENKHTFVKWRYNLGAQPEGGKWFKAYIYVGNDTDGWTECVYDSNSGGSRSVSNLIFFIIATGDNDYDCYHGYDKTTVSLTGAAQIRFVLTGVDNGDTVNAYIYFDDVRQSAYTIS